MTVQELIDILQAIANKNAIVILSKDAEGNNCSPLQVVDDSEETYYEAETTWSGELYDVEDVEGWSEEDTKNMEPCIVLWPVN